MSNPYKSTVVSFVEDLDDFLRTIILRNIPDIEGILIYGSIGRMEPSFLDGVVCSENLYNDIDIILISGKKIPADILLGLQNSIKNNYGVKWVDLSVRTPFYFRFTSKRSVLYYDYINGSRIIYEVNPRHRLLRPSQAINKRSEIRTLFFTRLYCLYAILEFSDGNLRCLGDRAFVHNQLAKALFAMLQAIDIRLDRFESSYYNIEKRFISGDYDSYIPVECKELFLKVLTGKSAPSSIFVVHSGDLLMFIHAYKSVFANMLRVTATSFTGVFFETKFDIDLIFRGWRSFLLKNRSSFLKKRNIDIKQCLLLDEILFVSSRGDLSVGEIDTLSLTTKEIKEQRENG